MDVWLIGQGLTPFGRAPGDTHRSLVELALGAALQDARMPGDQVGSVHVGTAATHAWGQRNIAGHVLLDDAIKKGLLPAGLPLHNVEGGCATGSLALAGAVRDVAAGMVEASLAIGVDKTFLAHDPAAIQPLFDGAMDRLTPERWQRFYAAQAAAHGLPWSPHERRSVLLDVGALAARWHMKRFGTTVEILAHIASKDHEHGTHNPLAQYGRAMSVEQILADKEVLAPFTRSMCAPISDGAAAVVVVGPEILSRLPAEVRERAVQVKSLALGSGTWRGLDEPSAVHHTARRAYAQAGHGPEAVDVACVHDANAFYELAATEDLGFCAPGQGGPWALSGASSLGGALPVNPAGGLQSKGHPLGATGLAMVAELMTQLRGEAGTRQVPGATVGLWQNGGGLVGFDEASVAVGVLSASRAL